LAENYKPYLGLWKWWSLSLLIHAILAAAILYPFSSSENPSSSPTNFHKIAIVFAPQPHKLTTPSMPTSLHSPIRSSSALTNTARTDPVGKIPAKNNAPTMQVQTKTLSKQTTLPKVLPKPRPTASKRMSLPALVKPKASPKDTTPLSNGTKASAKTSHSNLHQKRSNSPNKIDVSKTRTVNTADSPRLVHNKVQPPVTPSKHAKVVSLSSSTPPEDATTLTTASTERALPPVNGIDLEQVKYWGQNVRDTLVKLTKGLRTPGSAKVKIHLNNTGKLIGVTFIEKSQNVRFNSELNRRIKALAIFPAAPNGLTIEEMLFPIRLTVTH